MLIDSNIIVYAINDFSPKQSKAQNFLNKTKELYFAQQNIFESLRILTHPKFQDKMDPNKAIAAIMRIVDKGDVIFPLHDTYLLAFELIQGHKLSGNKIFDAYLYATALGYDIRQMATDNVKDFSKFGKIEIINPFI